MNLLKNLTIKISSTEDPPSPNVEIEKLDQWCIRCPFPDDDVYAYVINENGLAEGQPKQFYSLIDAEHYVAFHGLKNCVIEKM